MAGVGRLHLITDTTLQQRFSHLELAQMAVEAGADVLQYREKAYAPERHGKELAEIRALTRGTATKLVLNDYLELAATLGADGVHLGADDPPATDAGKRLPVGSVIGATVHTTAECALANTLDVTYVGIGPVFGTTSKHTALPPLGLAGLARLCQQSRHPVIAIGSISAARVADVLAAGAYGVAVLSAFCAADDPLSAAKTFRALLPGA